MQKKISLLVLLVFLLGAITLVNLPFHSWNISNSKIQQIESRYGEPLPWKEVSLLFPRYTIAVVEDLETGRRFTVERRGGTYHADVQPLTASDTKVLQEIFGEGWTWKRRAIIVDVGMKRIAGSMNGMPHGSGQIQGNNFKGHFCLHFLGSQVHKSRKIDPAHQMMIWKAAGQPVTPYLRAQPREVVELVTTAINQDDGELAVLGINPGGSEDLWLINQALLKQLPEIELKKISAIKGENQDPVKYQVQVKLLYPGERSKVTKDGELLLKLDRATGRWLIEGKELVDLLIDKD